MNESKYVGLDVHQSSVVAAVHTGDGKRLMESVLETQAEAIRSFLQGLRGTVHVTFEEGTQAAWLYDLVKPLVAEVIVCNPRANKLLASGTKSDRIDANKLAQLLRGGQLKAVYHGGWSIRPLKELVHNYNSLVGDTTRVMNRIKAVFRGRAINCAGRDVYYQRHRTEWLEKLMEPGARRRAEFLYEELEILKRLRREARKEMLREARRHSSYRLLIEIPVLGPIRVAEILARIASPHRFRTKRQLWTYCGLAVTTRSSAEYEVQKGRVQRRTKVIATRELNTNYNHGLKYVFKSAALTGGIEQEADYPDCDLRDPLEVVYRVSKLAANRPPVCVAPDATVQEAVTTMLTNDFSQLPVMVGEREVKGVVSWASIGARLSLGKNGTTARELMDSHQEIRADSSLFQAIPIIVTYQYVLIRGGDNRITGMVTASDLSLQFQQLAEPFLLLGEIENHIRRILGDKFTAAELAGVRDPGDTERQVNGVADLTFGEYIRLLEHPDRWAQVKVAGRLSRFRSRRVDHRNRVRHRRGHRPYGLTLVWVERGEKSPNQALHLTGAATLVSRGITVLQAAPAGELGR